MTSLDRPVGSEGETSLGELVSGNEAPPEEELEVSLRQEALRRAVAELPDRERDVLKLRFGLNGDPSPQSLEQIGKTLGLTRERVRQIESEALKRLAVSRELDAVRAAVEQRVDDGHRNRYRDQQASPCQRDRAPVQRESHGGSLGRRQPQWQRGDPEEPDCDPEEDEEEVRDAL